MSIKNLFGKSFSSYDSASVDVESPTFIDNTVTERETYIPPIDFATASNFVKYGSAELYYAKSIARIHDDYPYDGSKAEKILFHQSSSYLDRWMFELKYPKTTGFVTLGKTANYTAPNSNLRSSGYYPTSENEYIRTWGGLHTSSVPMEGSPIQNNFESSVKYNANNNRVQNWNLDLISGSTIEFWLQKPAFGISVGSGLPTTGREVLLDLWNGETSGSDNYGRLTLEITASGEDADPDGACILATLQSGTYGFMTSSVCPATVNTSSLSNWHHYAVSFVSAAGGVETRFYIDGSSSLSQTVNCGERVGLPNASIGSIPGLINGYIGALQHKPSGNVYTAYDMQGYAKLSGSLDEFRFWKTRRTSRQIELNWFRQIGGGANTDDNTTDLGVYYKFNEGITAIGIDSTVLDYSGRLANGAWIGYSSGLNPRSTGSAFNLSAQNLTESRDPIIYSFHPSVQSLSTEMATSGTQYDNEYGSSLYTSLPNWLLEEDGMSNQNLKYVSQILSSYFDTLYSQIEALPSLKEKRYLESQYKAPPFARALLEEKGFITKDLFVDSKIVERFSSADFNGIKFEKNLTEIKNLIYLNIYNNLEKILKSKGTEKSVRNFIRCFGIDDEIIKLNVYTDGGTHYLTNKATTTSYKKKYLNFNSSSYFSSTVFQTTGSSDNSLTFISGSDASDITASWGALTFEADVVIPYKKSQNEIGYFNTPFLSSSIFGFHEANESDSNDYTWEASEVANLQVYLTREEINSKNARITIKNQAGTINWASDYISEVYDNDRWNLAIRIKPNTYPYAGNVQTSSAPSYTLDFYGVNYNFDEIENLVTASFTLSPAVGAAYITRAKRIYAGAHVTNFTGALDTRSDIQVGAVRVWYDYLTDEAIQQHNLDPTNYGMKKTYEGSNIFLLGDTQVNSEQLAILNWDFDTVSSSNAAGQFTIDDITSGSAANLYGWLGNIIEKEYKGLGSGFGANSEAFLENEFLYAQIKELPEISFTNDNVYVKTQKQIDFIKDEDVSDNFYLLEKSINQVVSQQMINLFSNINEFSNLFGRPEDFYRLDYKRMDRVRQLFFERVQQDTDLETFINYYKWIDSSISKMVYQLIPASVNFGPGIIDVVESHILERNKYQRRVGLLTTVESTEGSMLGINDLTYSWKYGHNPVGRTLHYENERSLYFDYDSDDENTANFAAYDPSGPSTGLASPEMVGGWTFSFWFNYVSASTAAGLNYNFANFYRVSPSKTAMNLYLVPVSDDVYKIGFKLTDQNGSRTITYSQQQTDQYLSGNTWQHITLVASPSLLQEEAAKLYVNGVSSSMSLNQTYDLLYGLAGVDALNMGGLYVDGPWYVDEAVLISGAVGDSYVQTLYNGGKWLNVTASSTIVDNTNLLSWWRFGGTSGLNVDTDGDDGRIWSVTGSTQLRISHINDDTAVFSNSTFDKGDAYYAGLSYENCLYLKDREIRVGPNGIDREQIRKALVNQTNATSSTLSTITKAVYQGSTYVPRALGLPYKLSMDFSDSIHGGTNYNKQKDRNFVRGATWIHGKNPSTPVNVLTVGLGEGYGVLEKPHCTDVYDPNKIKILDLEVEVGKFAAANATTALTDKEEYMYKLSSNRFWPFNMVSGTLNSGYNSKVYSLFRSTAIVSNLHSDTIDITNEIPMQGPFTQAHVGGSQNRHVPINKYASGSLTTPAGQGTPNGLQYIYTRPEAWALLFGPNPLNPSDPDGAMGFVGADYGSTYPDTSKKLAIYYREEKAKRPVNVKNIRSTTGSSVLGNYQHGYEVLSTFSNQRYYFRRAVETTGSFLPKVFTTIGAAAVGFITLTGNPGVGKVLRLTDADATTQDFEFINSAGLPSDGSKVGSNVAISVFGLAGDETLINPNIVSAINGAQGLGFCNISAFLQGDGTIKLTQGSTGPSGNGGINNVNVANLTVTNFAGGFSNPAGKVLSTTTNYMTLVAQAPFLSGNVFGVANNNRQPATTSLAASITAQATGVITVDTTSWPSYPSSYENGSISTAREGESLINLIWKVPATMTSLGIENGDIIPSGFGAGSVAVTFKWDPILAMQNWVNAFNGANAYNGNSGACTATGSSDGQSGTLTVTIIEVGLAGSSGNGGGLTKVSGQGAITAPGSPGFAGGTSVAKILGANNISIEIPRTDLTSSRHTITTRFSSPGGPEINSRGYLDIATGQYSAYNNMNYRNYSIRSSGSGENQANLCPDDSYASIRVVSNIDKQDGMQTLLRRHCGKFGADGVYGTTTAGTYVTVPAYFKQHRNTLTRPKISSSFRRKGIKNVETTTGPAGLQADISPHWQIKGGHSYSFWYRDDHTNDTISYIMWTQGPTRSPVQIYVSPSAAPLMNLYFKEEFADGTTHTTQWTDAVYTLLDNDWHFITIVREQNNLIPRLFLDGNEISREDIQATTTTAEPPTISSKHSSINEVYLLDGYGTGGSYELQGSLSNFAIWNKALTGDAAVELYQLEGIAIGLDGGSGLEEYWSLGEEEALSAISFGSSIPQGTILNSVIGGSALTARYLNSCSVGPYDIHTSVDTNVYNNMNVTSMIPASTFQYSWIKTTLTSSDWLVNQRVRGYAPRSGEMRIIGASKPAHMVSAITFPTASDLYGE